MWEEKVSRAIDLIEFIDNTLITERREDKKPGRTAVFL